MNQLTGVANNLAHSIISSTNQHHLRQFESLPLEKTRLIEIDLLKETIKPDNLITDSVKSMILHYKKWFSPEIKTLNIDEKEIEGTNIRIETDLETMPGKAMIRKYIYNVIITAKRKEYKKEAKASWQ